MPLSSSDSLLLALPHELRIQILTLLLTSSTPHLRVSCLFIRSNWQNKFMTQQTLNINTQILRANKQLNREGLPILYSQALWRCACRFDALRSQIGRGNFRLLRKIECDFDDLSIVASELHEFENLIELRTEAYQVSALTARGTRAAKREAVKLCEAACAILRGHRYLRVLAQSTDISLGRGRSDAVDLSFGRVSWRFLRGVEYVGDEEMVVDCERLVVVLRGWLEGFEAGDDVHGMWAGGVFRQYPHLGRLTAA